MCAYARAMCPSAPSPPLWLIRPISHTHTQFAGLVVAYRHGLFTKKGLDVVLRGKRSYTLAFGLD